MEAPRNIPRIQTHQIAFYASRAGDFVGEGALMGRLISWVSTGTASKSTNNDLLETIVSYESDFVGVS